MANTTSCGAWMKELKFSLLQFFILNYILFQMMPLQEEDKNGEETIKQADFQIEK